MTSNPETINKFFAQELGKCWHEFHTVGLREICTKCGLDRNILAPFHTSAQNQFSPLTVADDRDEVLRHFMEKKPMCVIDRFIETTYTVCVVDGKPIVDPFAILADILDYSIITKLYRFMEKEK
jgi:hypothetical protein